jgi:hypothetical protein
MSGSWTSGVATGAPVGVSLGRSPATDAGGASGPLTEPSSPTRHRARSSRGGVRLTVRGAAGAFDAARFLAAVVFAADFRGAFSFAATLRAAVFLAGLFALAGALARGAVLRAAGRRALAARAGLDGFLRAPGFLRAGFRTAGFFRAAAFLVAAFFLVPAAVRRARGAALRLAIPPSFPPRTPRSAGPPDLLTLTR